MRNSTSEAPTVAGVSETNSRPSPSLHVEAPVVLREPGPVQVANASNPWTSGVLDLPRVSAVVTSHNYSAYVASALDSIAAQDYPNLECVIVDDASTDDSVAVIENWLARNNDRRFRLIASHVNRGQLASLAAALAVVDGEFVATLDADDFWLPGFVRRHVQAHLSTAAVCSASCSDLLQVDREGRAISGTARWRDFHHHKRKIGMPIAADELPRLTSSGAIWDPSGPSKVRMVHPDLFRWHWSASSAMMFRRRMVDLMMPTKPRIKPIGADHYLMVLCHFFTGSLVLDEALGAYRRHGGNLGSSLPVLGTTANNSPGNHEEVFDRNFSAMLDHVLDTYDTLVSTFGPYPPRQFVVSVKRYLKRRGVEVDAERVRERLSLKSSILRSRVFASVRSWLESNRG